MPKRTPFQKAAVEAATRKAVLDATCEILTKDGLDGLTMDAVAEQTGVSKGTLYNYFQNKKELLRFVDDSLFAPVEEELTKTMAEKLPPRQRIRKGIRSFLVFFEERQRIAMITIGEFCPHPLSLKAAECERRKFIYNSFYPVIAELLPENLFGHYEASHVTRIILGAIMGLLEGRINLDVPRAINEDLDDVMNLFFPEPPELVNTQTKDEGIF